MRSPAIDYLFRILYYLRVPRLIGFIQRKKIVILTYHGFTGGGSEEKNLLDLDAARLEEQLRYLKKYYNVIPLGLLVDHLRNGTRIPDRAVVITIDDGYKSVYRFAYPVLKKYNVPATIFLSTDFIDKKEFLFFDRVRYAIGKTEASSIRFRIDSEELSFSLNDNISRNACIGNLISRLIVMRQELMPEVVREVEAASGKSLLFDGNIPERYLPLEWQEVFEMINSGLITIGSHSCSHVILSRARSDDMKREICLSKEVIEKKIDLACDLFSYPNGESGDYDGRTKGLLKISGYSCGLTTAAGMNDGRTDLYELKRFHISGKTDLSSFTMILTGVFAFLVKVKKRVFKKQPVYKHPPRAIILLTFFLFAI